MSSYNVPVICIISNRNFTIKNYEINSNNDNANTLDGCGCGGRSGFVEPIFSRISSAATNTLGLPRS